MFQKVQVIFISIGAFLACLPASQACLNDSSTRYLRKKKMKLHHIGSENDPLAGIRRKRRRMRLYKRLKNQSFLRKLGSRKKRVHHRSRQNRYLESKLPKRFTLVLDLITGKFARHSKRFHRWRVRDRIKKLRKEPKNLGWYDDLAVSYDKLGKQKRALATIRKKEKVKPGLYETYANMGTFFIHEAVFKRKTKSFPKGLRYLNKAVEINPNAHFGREIYQILLVEHIIQQRKALTQDSVSMKGVAFGDKFADFVMKQKEKGRTFIAQQYFPVHIQRKRALRDAAVRGILGMMRFGHYRSPVLLGALGSLLGEGYGAQGQRVAARAFLKASYESRSRKQRRFLLKRAKGLLKSVTKKKLGKKWSRWKQKRTWKAFKRQFRKENRVARKWSRKVRRQEHRWLRTEKDPERKFLETYLGDTSTTSGRLLLLSNTAFSKKLQKAFPVGLPPIKVATPVKAKKKTAKAKKQVVAKKAKVQKEETGYFRGLFLLFLLLFLFPPASVLLYQRYQAKQLQRWDAVGFDS